MSVIEYPAKSFHKLTRQQLITLAIALEEQRDRAIAKSEELPQTVLDHINQRSEYVQAALGGPMSNDDADYYRWQGHMEARRQLAESLGYTVPYKVTDRTEKVPPKLDEPE